MASAEEKKKKKPKSVVSESNWTVSLAVRHALKSDPAIMQRTADITSSSRTHIELIVRYKCIGTEEKKCQWCARGSKVAGKTHAVIYTVRDNATVSGVVRLCAGATLNAKGGWTLYAVKVNKEQRRKLIAFCEHYIGAPYRSLAAYMCIKSCCPCCGQPWYEDAEGGELGPHYPMNCSGYVSAALIRAGVLKRNDPSEMLDPFRLTPDDVVNALFERKVLTLLSEIPPELCPV